MTAAQQRAPSFFQAFQPALRSSLGGARGSARFFFAHAWVVLGLSLVPATLRGAFILRQESWPPLLQVASEVLFYVLLSLLLNGALHLAIHNPLAQEALKRLSIWSAHSPRSAKQAMSRGMNALLETERAEEERAHGQDSPH